MFATGLLRNPIDIQRYRVSGDDHRGACSVCVFSNDRLQTAECHVWLSLAVFECRLLYVVHASRIHSKDGVMTSTDQIEIDLASFVQ